MNNFFDNLFNRNNRMPHEKKGTSIMTKIVSVIIAVVLWMYVIGEVNPEIVSEVKNIEVKLVNVEKLAQAGLVVMGQDYYSVNMQLRGRRSDVVNITPQDINAIADIRGFGKGENSVPVEVNLPSNLEVESINPVQIKVSLDEVVRRSKPVKIEFAGSAASGYIHGTPVIEEPEIMVSGPETFVKSVDHVIASVNLDNTDQDIKRNFTFRMVDSGGDEVLGVHSEDVYVNVYVPIYRVKNVPVDVTTVGNPAEGFEIVSTVKIPSRVEIMGRDEDIETIDGIQAQQVSVEGISETKDINLSVNLPENVQLVNPERPPRLKVNVERIISMDLLYDPEEIEIIGLADRFDAEIDSADPVRLTVEDIESVIGALTKEDITLSLDLSDLREQGEHSAKVTWSSDKDIRITQMENDTVRVKISRKE